MIVGKLERDGVEILFLGLTTANVLSLQQGKPITVQREKHGPAVPEGLRVVIQYGASEVAIAAELAERGEFTANTIILSDTRSMSPEEFMKARFEAETQRVKEKEDARLRALQERDDVHGS
jgi:hypothetical protein